jgi:hypothetical protein
MARGPHRDERGVGLAPIQPLDGVGPSARGQHCGSPGTGGGRRVLVYPASTALAEPLEGVEVSGSMDPFQLDPGRGARRHRDQGVAHPRRPDARQHGFESGWPLWMSATGQMFEERLVGLQEHRACAHPVDARPPASPAGCGGEWALGRWRSGWLWGPVAVWRALGAGRGPVVDARVLGRIGRYAYGPP